jgi:hypothetical protein
MNLPHVVSTIDAYCVGGTSVTFNIEDRSIIGTVGNNLTNPDMIATTSGVSYSTGTYTTGTYGAVVYPNLPAGSWLWLDISGVVGGVTQFVVTLGVS